jgi:FtsP/CotA-like multicopper oxidase with cupredoxin domain
MVPGTAGMPAMPGDVSVTSLTGPRTGTPQVSATLVAREQQFRLATGQQVDGYTLNGTSPGPLIRARQGDLIQVTLRNANVADGVTLHWHGVDVPNAEDGVAGVTQDAVPPHNAYVYRFVARDAGTYWYHSHQMSDPQVRGGLFGTLVIAPRSAPPTEQDVVAALHSYEGVRTISGRTGTQHVTAGPGERVRIRVIDTDNGPLRAWVSGGQARLLAVDGHDVNQPGPIGDRYIKVPAGGRADLEVTAPADGSVARVDLGGAVAVMVGPASARAATATAPRKQLDMLTYGSAQELPFDVSRPDRRFSYRIGRRIGFQDGMPGFWWTINGRQYPDVPMFVVSRGDVVQMTISNHGLVGTDVHPIHLHGHHAVVLSRNGVQASGSRWWVDSLDVSRGETYRIAFRADNPGIWMDHCHNLDHAADGMTAHLAYAGVSEPFEIGHDVGGEARNKPE